MIKQIAPNSCLFCELPHNVHGSRLDGLHPPGVWTWVEPSDRVRLQRMKRNRAIRKETAMTGLAIPLSSYSPEEWVGKWVTYHGRRRLAEYGNGNPYKVVEKRDDDASVGFDTGEANLQWAAPWSLHVVDEPVSEKPEPMTTARAEEILNPHSNTLESLDAEIKRLEEKIRDLRSARQVIANL